VKPVRCGDFEGANASRGESEALLEYLDRAGATATLHSCPLPSHNQDPFLILYQDIYIKRSNG